MEKELLQTVGNKAGALLQEKLEETRGVGEKIVHLMDELATMNAVFRMISEADESSVDHLVLEWAKQVRELAYDSEDCIDTYWLGVCRPLLLTLDLDEHTGGKPTPLIRNLLCQAMLLPSVAVHQFQKLWLRFTLAGDIKALLARTAAVSERRARYGIDRASLPRSAPAVWAAPARSLCRADRDDQEPDQLVGITEKVNALAERIRAVDERDMKLKVFSLVGFGGLGKTTLAMQVCGRLDADFQRQMMVSVSQAFHGEKDVKGLLLRVLQQILDGEDRVTEEDGEERVTKEEGGSKPEIGQMDLEQLATKLKELLQEKRYLIVIDDVWSTPAWEAIRIRLPENNCGSRIIVTTRMETVARSASVSEDSVHHMEALELEASQKLFVKKVFGSRDCPTELKNSMDKILKKCGGLPLAIVSIASLLASHNSVESVETWIRVSSSIGTQMESNPTLDGMRRLITLSYDYLPHHLKACMMYLSIFPEDYTIDKDRLLYRWIAEGLVAERRGLTLFEVAEEYLDELISRNMILVEEKTCRVHDMMLEVMVSKSLQANFVSIVGRQFGGGMPSYSKVRRLSVHDNGLERPKKKVEQHHRGIEAMKLDHVRSLTTFQSEGLTKLLDRLGEFKLLRVLDLEDCQALQNQHMRDVCRLYLLRFLSLKGTGISLMPPEVGDLEHLETLDMKESRIREVPQTVTRLRKLERLKTDLWVLPQGLGNMTALREIDRAALKGDDVQVAGEIGELHQLQVLSLILQWKGDATEDCLNALASSLSRTYAVRSLRLESRCDVIMLGQRLHITVRPSIVRFGEDKPMDFLPRVSSPPPLLQCLTLHGPILRLPKWISSLTYLKQFSVVSTQLTGDHMFDLLCNLPSLLSIELGQSSWEGKELVARTTHKFPVLRIFDMYASDAKVLRFEQGSMAKLQTLLLGFDQFSDTTIDGLKNLKSLREVKLRGKKNTPALEGAAEQFKALNQSRTTESKQIKVVVEYR
uniref:Uncharacterized protein n=1 Tax=Avena sativa TaxID=4498 RepID=A0ACD5TTK5_AVESA